MSKLTLVSSSVYRVAELGDGWTGKILRTQVYFSKYTVVCTTWLLLSGVNFVGLFDGGMIVVAIFALNIFHPGFLLRLKTLKRGY